MTTPPIVLVPGFWLGAWAWDEFADDLRSRGHHVHSVTRPGLHSPAEQYREGVAEGHSFLAGVPELEHLTWVDLPTSHWPMWSRPADLAEVVAGVADAVGT